MFRIYHTRMIRSNRIRFRSQTVVAAPKNGWNLKILDLLLIFYTFIANKKKDFFVLKKIFMLSPLINKKKKNHLFEQSDVISYMFDFFLTVVDIVGVVGCCCKIFAFRNFIIVSSFVLGFINQMYKIVTTRFDLIAQFNKG